jgi:hypothetical protein
MNFAKFLDRSLLLLEAEAPAAHRAVVATLGDRSVNVEVDAELLSIFSDRDRVVTGPPFEQPTTIARTTRPALRRLLRGERDLTASILQDEVALLGAVEDLVALHDALIWYFRGAVRSPSFPGLLDEFLDLDEYE